LYDVLYSFGIREHPVKVIIKSPVMTIDENFDALRDLFLAGLLAQIEELFI
jgi:hypothetical protein